MLAGVPGSLRYLRQIGRPVIGAANAEALDRELEQDLSRCLKLGYLGSAEFLEFREPGRVGRSASAPRLTQTDRVGPYFLARLSQEPPGSALIERLQQPVHPRARPVDGGQLVALGRHPGREDLVDRLVVGLAPSDQLSIVKFLVGDHR